MIQYDDDYDEDWYDDGDDPDDEDAVDCPECGGLISGLTDKCASCGYWLSAADRRKLRSEGDRGMIVYGYKFRPMLAAA